MLILEIAAGVCLGLMAFHALPYLLELVKVLATLWRLWLIFAGFGIMILARVMHSPEGFIGGLIWSALFTLAFWWEQKTKSTH